MKRIFTFLALLVSLGAMAQKYEYKGLKNFPVSSETGKVTYEGVVEAEGRTAAQLYSAAKEWVVLNYPNANEVIQQDEPNSQIVGRGSLQEASGSTVLYKFILSFKEGKYRYEITNLTDYYLYGGQMRSVPIEESITPTRKTNAKYYDSQYAALNKQLEVIAQAFSSIPQNKKEDW